MLSFSFYDSYHFCIFVMHVLYDSCSKSIKSKGAKYGLFGILLTQDTDGPYKGVEIEFIQVLLFLSRCPPTHT